MKISILKNRIESLKDQRHLIVLKGFPGKDVLELSKHYELLDKNVFEGDKIALERLNATTLLVQIMQASTDKTLLMTYEGYLQLVSKIRDLSVTGKEICILVNNLISQCENPSTADIPDFDNADFQTSTENAPYAEYYSYCTHIDGKQYVEYIEIDSDFESSYKAIDFIEPVEVHSKGVLNVQGGKVSSLSGDDGTLDKALTMLYNDMLLPEGQYVVDAETLKNTKLQVLVSAAKLVRFNLSIYVGKTELNVSVRPELKKYLKKIWGYNSFRSLKIYEDLQTNRNVTEISQGEIIETVIRQSEAAHGYREDTMMNVLLTSPTGAGKSLLFQLSAIYLAEKYGLLTIVVSPLVALMNDQVDNLVDSYEKVATLNGNQSFAEKEDIMQRVLDGSVNILYLAPELLLSYTLSTFVGTRKVGLMVIDEAHTVTTWGRDFRVDYWFLGDYLRAQKAYMDYSFPIFALTATAVWDPTGKNDMVFDTIRSLFMDPCIKYIGVVRRENISFEISTREVRGNYEHERTELTVKEIKRNLAEKKKAILYFPYKSLVNKLMRHEDLAEVERKISTYHADLSAFEKRSNADDFRSGSRPVMLATKAYGMGVDVSDISVVYHHAPTGCLSDYVQEIGRLARDPKIKGIARIDFTEKDFKYTRTLHGLSTIKHYELRMVLKKLMALYKLNGSKRNLLITASDFDYIFKGDNVDLDQKVKSCLLLISHDLMNKLRFNALIVRPKSLFAKTYIQVGENNEIKFNQTYGRFVTLADDRSHVYLLDADALWSAYYKEESFPSFKRKLAMGEILGGYGVRIMNKIVLELQESTSKTLDRINEFFTLAHGFLQNMASTHHRLPREEMMKQLPAFYNRERRELFVETFKLLYCSNNNIASGNAYCQIYRTKKDEEFQFMASGYEALQTRYLTLYRKEIHAQDITMYRSPKDDVIYLAEMMNSLGVANYQRLGGEDPSIFIRINNPNYLNELVRFNNYQNNILEGIYEKFKYSEEVFTHFFCSHLSDQQRWDFIEAYFLGASKEELFKIGN